MIKTGYSFRTAVGHVSDVLSRLKEVGWTHAPIADRNSTFGFNIWTKLAKKEGLKPIYGVELAVTPSLGDKKPIVDFWTFLAVDSLRPLHDLIWLATSNPGKEPSLTYTQALLSPLIKIAGERALVDQLPLNDDFFFALSPATPIGLFRAAKKAGHRFVAMNANVYPREADREFYRVALGAKRSSTQTYPQHILSDAEWIDFILKNNPAVGQNDLEQAVFARDQTFARCRAEMKKATLLTPEKPKTLRELCEDGAKRTGTDLSDPVYAARLERELQLIADKNFEDYFFIIADLVNWAKERMIVGPARGSSCGSLVCFLLNITTIDPIPYGLIFERFIDVTRQDLPDIDIDFSDVRRQMLFDYAEEKYGRERVARLGTVGLFMAKSALNQAGKELRVPTWAINKVSDSIIIRSSGDSRFGSALEDTIKETDAGRSFLEKYPEMMIAARMEAHPNNPSQHAAGIVLTNEPVREYVAVDARTKATMCVKKDAEDLNLLKIDALGLTQLSVFERTMQLIGKPDRNGWLETLPTNDEAAFEVLNRGHFSGIFQFNGQALRSLVKQIKVTQIEDVIAMTALARPGPLATGGSASWVKRKNGIEAPVPLHPMLSEVTAATFGVTVYQEQVMNIVRKMGQMSWEDTSAIRKAMSGRKGDEFFAQFRKKFIDGAVSQGVDEALADAIWKQINTFGSWAFNRSHAVAYGLVSYWCCYLKAHHRMAFAAATLDAESDPMRQIELLRELKEEGIDYVSVDQEHSADRWTITERDGKQILVGPLTNIKGFGPASVQEILDCRRRGEPVRAALTKRLKDARTPIDSLYPVADRIAALHPDLAAINIVSTPLSVISVQPGVRGDVMVFAVAKKIAPRDENEPGLVQKRNGRLLYGPTQALNLFVQDDSDEIFCKIDRYNFERIGRDVVERGRAGKALYAIKGTVPPDFRMIKVRQIKYLGDMEADLIDQQAGGGDE